MYLRHYDNRYDRTLGKEYLHKELIYSEEKNVSREVCNHRFNRRNIQDKYNFISMGNSQPGHNYTEYKNVVIIAGNTLIESGIGDTETQMKMRNR